MRTPIRLRSAATALVVVVSAGCQDVLSVQPETFSGTTTYYQTPDQMERAIFGAYSVLQTTYGGGATGPMWLLGEMRADNTTYEFNVQNRSTAPQETIDTFVTSADNNSTVAGWNNAYVGILQANTILDRIDPVVYTDAAAKTRVIGEARFLRALHYFNLVRLFGAVPLIVHETQSYEGAFNSTRTPVDSVLKVVIADAKDAIAKLPTRAALPAAQRGRATQGAASMLLADVYMWQKNWQEAATVLQTVTTMGYALVTTGTPTAYDRVFDPAGKNGPESIFEIQYTDAVIGEGSAYTVRFAPITSGTTFTAGGDNANNGGWNIPTRDMLRAYEPGDQRKAASIGFYVNATRNPAETDVAIGDTIPWVKKFSHPYTLAGRQNDDFPVWRYAETLLNYAEVLNELGRTAEAYPFINQVRARAGLAPLAAGLSQAAFRDAVFREQRVELAFENKRWFQLVRTDRAVATMNTHGAELKAYAVGRRDPGTYNVTANMLIYPIPVREITTNGLTQNPGY
jgi:starch-binding outer membrane protein, SusD/RagB family